MNDVVIYMNASRIYMWYIWMSYVCHVWMLCHIYEWRSYIHECAIYIYFIYMNVMCMSYIWMLCHIYEWRSHIYECVIRIYEWRSYIYECVIHIYVMYMNVICMSYIWMLCHMYEWRSHPPARMNHVKIFKGWPPRDAPSELVQLWYTTFPPDRFLSVANEKPN